jgi:hypothetical protein
MTPIFTLLYSLVHILNNIPSSIDDTSKFVSMLPSLRFIPQQIFEAIIIFIIMVVTEKTIYRFLGKMMGILVLLLLFLQNCCYMLTSYFASSHIGMMCTTQAKQLVILAILFILSSKANKLVKM